MRPIARLPMTLVALAGLGIFASAADGALKVEPLGIFSVSSANLATAATIAATDQRGTTRNTLCELPVDGSLLDANHNFTGASSIPTGVSQGATDVAVRMANVCFPRPVGVFRFLSEAKVDLPEPQPTSLLRPPSTLTRRPAMVF